MLAQGTNMSLCAQSGIPLFRGSKNLRWILAIAALARESGGGLPVQWFGSTFVVSRLEISDGGVYIGKNKPEVH